MITTNEYQFDIIDVFPPQVQWSKQHWVQSVLELWLLHGAHLVL